MARNSMIAAHERHARIARAVMRQLRAEGISTEWVDVRTVRGFRLVPVSLRSCGVSILCRPVGYALTTGDRAYMRAAGECYVQYGAADIAHLTVYLRQLSTVRNPFETR